MIIIVIILIIVCTYRVHTPSKDVHGPSKATILFNPKYKKNYIIQQYQYSKLSQIHNIMCDHCDQMDIMNCQGEVCDLWHF